MSTQQIMSSSSWLSTLSNFLQPYDARQRTLNASSTGHRILEEKDGQQQRRQQHQLKPIPNTVSKDLKPKVIFAAGLSFLALSSLVTRRSFARRRLASKPQLFTDHASHTAAESAKASPGLDAIEALNIATINILSLAMVGVGGTLWYLDINSTEDARRWVRGGLGVDGTGRDEQEVEEDYEVWIARTLAKGEEKDAAKARARRKEVMMTIEEK